MSAGAHDTRLNYCVEWAPEKQRSWSGTVWGLHEALLRHYDVYDVELSHVSGLLKREYILRDRLHMKDLELRKMRCQQREFDRRCGSTAGPFFQFAEVPGIYGNERHYIYQDLSVEWLWRCRNEDPETFKYTGFSDVTKRAMRERLGLQRDFYQGCAGVFTMGLWMRDYLVDECGLPPSKVHHVGGGINSRPPAMIDAQRQGNTFLFAGRDFVRKGGDLVLAAFAQLHEIHPELRLVVAGPRQNPAPGAPGVDYVGDVSNERLGVLMASADVFVMPSRFEAYGLVFPEALSAGLPCVGRNRFEMPHFICDGEDGRFIHSDDTDELAAAMWDCLISPTLRENARKHAEEIRAQYRWDVVADRISQVIDADLSR